MVSRLARFLLSACGEAVLRQQEIVPLLAEVLDAKPSEIFYKWMERQFKQTGVFANGEWKHFFHGGECDLTNLVDGRCLRVDFGPHGRLDTFTGFGVLQFVMTSKAPWREFPELRDYLAEKPPPFDRLSGSHARMTALFDELKTAGFVEVADPELCALIERHTVINAPGQTEIRLPTDLPNTVFFDMLASKRYVLSQSGLQAIAETQSNLE
jgi:hypothetical protein